MSADGRESRTSGTRLTLDLEAIGGELPVVVLAEDERDLRTVIADCLLSEGFVVVAVPCVERLERVVGAVTASAVVVDLNLGPCTSERVIEDLVQRGRRAAVVLVSASASAGAVARKYGVRFVQKPFDLDELVEAVRHAAESATAAPRASRSSHT